MKPFSSSIEMDDGILNLGSLLTGLHYTQLIRDIDFNPISRRRCLFNRIAIVRFFCLNKGIFEDLERFIIAFISRNGCEVYSITRESSSMARELFNWVWRSGYDEVNKITIYGPPPSKRQLRRLGKTYQKNKRPLK